MSSLSDRVRIVCTPETCGGKPRIDGHRITVKHIVLDHQRRGMSPDEIVSAYPSPALSDVYAALAYYYDHRVDINADIKTDEELARVPIRWQGHLPRHPRNPPSTSRTWPVT